jgi:hypothetical protein
MHRFITIIILCTLLAAPAGAQTVPGGLVKALAAGDADEMAVYFHNSLEMNILEKDHMCSKAQATRIMESFFRDYAPSSFIISFEGAKEKSKYAIGSLTTEKGSFRVNLFFLNMDGKRLIYYLSIEKESEYELRP